MKIWIDVLALSDSTSIGINSNFFELGGHSLNLTVLLARIHKNFGISVPLNFLFEEPTIMAISDFIKKTIIDTISISESLILLRKGNSESNAFFIHTGSGDLIRYNIMINNLESNFNCWGISLPNLKYELLHQLSISDLSEIYINFIKTIQKQGPYHIVGRCIGGYISHEITNQLEKSGETIFSRQHLL